MGKVFQEGTQEIIKKKGEDNNNHFMKQALPDRVTGNCVCVYILLCMLSTDQAY